MSKQSRWATVATLAVILCTGVREPVRAGAISEVVVFGDSHSDTGNFGFKFSNGLLWVEELAGQLGLPAPRPSGAGGLDYAWASARTGFGHDMVAGISVPRVGEQVTDYLASHSVHDNKLFVLNGGGNDFGAGGQRDPSIPVSNLSDHISALAAAGGVRFVVVNLNPLGHVPARRGTDRELVFRSLTEQFNGLLVEELSDLQERLGVTIHCLDFFALVSRIIADPALHGFSNVEDPAQAMGNNPEESLYWDNHHFTSIVHRMLGQEAASILRSDPKQVPSSSTWVLIVLGSLLVCIGAGMLKSPTLRDPIWAYNP